MPFYDSIASGWHRLTGSRGGVLKEYVLNELLLDRMGSPEGRAILELGAGNGYFFRLAMQRYSGQLPRDLVITDLSASQLEQAQRHFAVPGARYQQLDARSSYPFEDASFDLILATMVFNEIAGGLRRALRECARVLTPGGQLLATVLHPRLVADLEARGELRPGRGGLTMPGGKGLRLPVVRRSQAAYERLLTEAGFTFETLEVEPSPEVLRAKPGLRKGGPGPVALIFDARKQ